MIEDIEDDFSTNSLLFNISISAAYYEKIWRNKDDLSVNEWLQKADQYFINSEPKYYDIHYGHLILTRLNTYLDLRKHEEIINMCNDFFKKFTGSMLKYTKNIILFYKAKAHIRLNQIQDAYEIYQNIVDYFTKENRLDKAYLFHITHDYGRYFETIKEYEKSLEYYNKSLSILNMMQDRENYSIAYSRVTERIKAVEKLLKS